MSTRTPRLTARVTIPMRDEVVVALDDSAEALGITRAEAVREAVQNWLHNFHAPVTLADTELPEWSRRILEEGLSHEEKTLQVFDAVEEFRRHGRLSHTDERMVQRELHRQFIEYSRKSRAGLV